ncbi:putative ABC transport system permease protein [Dyadobacter jejuensis]|uniref:Putative ABC transport system permease protein n=1 Tax=Dyadobacter jejuensis TaxID=1082580 RepID=A0A316AI69_9BACT|nr:FtsX-like permease family protein [Dyadobacter jejuensis]PWJ56939.1 putative ABC transport system permease protein [Dyadobacter jejuensis]
MNIVQLSLANLREKKLNSFLSIMLLTLGIGMISLLLLLDKQLESQFKRNIKGVDMVVGAKGSPLQLILSSIYQIDAPTGNIPLTEVNRLARNPFVKTVIPLSMGDSYHGYRIIGTDSSYVRHFEAQLAQGTLFSESQSVTIGAKVAKATGLKIGDTFEGAHGLDGAGEAHGAHPYKVVGVFEANGSVIDQLILTSLESIWQVHDHEEEAPGLAALNELEQGGEAHGEHGKEITSALIKFRNPMGLMTLPRQINQNTSMQSALPSIEINRLFSLLGIGIDTLRALALLIIVIAGLSVFISLYNSLKERKYEMALMLSMGATRSRLFGMLLLEGIILSVMGYVFGIGLSRVGLWLFAQSAEKDYHYDFSQFQLLPNEWYLLGAALLVGFLAALLPSLGIYRVNISRTLAEE